MLRPRLAAVAALFLSFNAFAQSPPSQPPIEAFATLPVISHPWLSPDGKRLALIQAFKGRPVATVWTLDPAGGRPVIMPYTEGYIVDARWANNQRLLLTVNLNARVWGDNVNPWFRTVALDADGKNPVGLFSNREQARDINYSTSDFIDMAPRDPDHVYIALYADRGVMQGDKAVNTVFKVDVNTGQAQPIEHGGADTVSWIMDGNGGIVAREDLTHDPLVDHILVYTPEKNWRWREIAKTDATAGRGFDIFGLSMDGKSLVVNRSTEVSGLGSMALSDGKVTDLYFNPIYDIDHTITDPWTGRVLGVAYVSHMRKSVYFDPGMQMLQEKLEGQFRGSAVSMLSWDLTKNKVVVAVEAPMSPTTFYLINQQTKEIMGLGTTHPQVHISDVGRVNVYDYKARDGLQIPAYLTLPQDKAAKNLPVVILPHGGPMARDDMSFDWESQFLANRGYAVLRPNFRGSSGYGQKFEEAGYGQWGLKMQDDITDGVKKLIADGIADPKRICIVGGSYGGYAALAGAAFTPDIYACAAAWAPVTDLREFLKTRKREYGKDSWMISTWTHYIGDRSDDSEKLDAASPALHADRIKIPVLLVHGDADATVRIDQSRDMDRALRRAGKKVTFVRIENETHYMQSADTRIRWLTELEAFLKQNIGN